MTPASPRRLAPRQTSRGGVSLLEIKFLFTKADAGVIKGYRTKADLAWGGSHLEKKIPLHQGSPRRDQGIRTKADLAWGGAFWKIKISFYQGWPRRDRGICMKEILVRRLVNSEILFRTTRQVSMNERIRVKKQGFLRKIIWPRDHGWPCGGGGIQNLKFGVVSYIL